MSSNQTPDIPVKSSLQHRRAAGAPGAHGAGRQVVPVCLPCGEEGLGGQETLQPHPGRGLLLPLGHAKRDRGGAPTTPRSPHGEARRAGGGGGGGGAPPGGPPPPGSGLTRKRSRSRRKPGVLLMWSTSRPGVATTMSARLFHFPPLEISTHIIHTIHT